MKKIIPSKPFSDLQTLQDLAEKVVGKVETIQVDICDGKYVKNISWPVSEYGVSGLENIGAKNDFDFAFPHWDRLKFQADLMVEQPEKYIKSLVQFGFEEMIFHFRSICGAGEVGNALGEVDRGKICEANFSSILGLCIYYELKIYIAVDVKTDLQLFLNFLEKQNGNISGVQVMGIANIGMQGQEFDEKSLDIVRKLKDIYPDLEVLFDGSINEETLEKIYDAGVDTFCIGSMLTESSDIVAELKYLKENLV